MPRAAAAPPPETEPEEPAPPRIMQLLASGPNDTHAAWGVLEDGTVRALARDGNRLVAIEDPPAPEEPDEEPVPEGPVDTPTEEPPAEEPAAEAEAG